MKNCYLLLLPLAICLLLNSCSKDLSLSCNPDIDKWAKENLSNFDNRPREDLTMLPIKKARAIYRGLPNEKKSMLWTLKVEEYSRSERLTGEEKDDYEQLLDIIPLFYGEQRIKDSSYKVVETWEKQMRDIHGWTDEKIFWSSCTWMTKEEYQRSTILQIKYSNPETKGGFDPSPPPEEEDKDCECIYDIGCGGGLKCDKKTQKKCQEVYDCGIVGTSPCTGICL